MPHSTNNSKISLFLKAPLRSCLLWATLASLVAACGEPKSDSERTAMLLPKTIGEWVKQDAPLTYDRETIFDYINGAGEVYRSYAFSHVLVDRYERSGAQGQGVTVELFDMGNPADAFGVFSDAREQEEAGIGAGFERKGSVLCFWQDRFYVCVAAEQRDPDPGAALGEIASGISENLPAPGSRPALVTALPSKGRVPFSDRFFHTHQSLNYHYYLVRENVLNLTPATDVVLARYQPGSTYLLVIRYEQEGDASAALSSFRDQIAPGSGSRETAAMEGGTYVSSSQEGRFLVVVLDAVSAGAADELRLAALESLTQLTQ